MCRQQLNVCHASASRLAIIACSRSEWFCAVDQSTSLCVPIPSLFGSDVLPCLHIKTLPRKKRPRSWRVRGVNTTLNPRTRRTPAHVIFSRVAQDLSHRDRFHVSLTKTVVPRVWHSMSHTPSLLFPSQSSTTSLSTLSTCTPIRPSSCPTTRLLLTSSSHGDFPCADPVFRSCG